MKSKNKKIIQRNKKNKNSITDELKIIKKKLHIANKGLKEALTQKTQLQSENISMKNSLNMIYSSRLWKIFVFSHRFILLIFPRNGFIRNFVSYVIARIKLIPQLINNLAEKLEILSVRIIKSLHINKPKDINYKSKKIVYIGHSRHAKTKSTVFLIKFLRKFFNVKTVPEHTWEGKPFPDLSFINKSYLAVIFFQTYPSPEILSKIKCDNIIYFPMYDSFVGSKFKTWKHLQKIKVINFSKTTHNTFKSWGFDSIYIQYFPKPPKFQKGNKREIFFWQRITKLNIYTILKLIGNHKFKIHINKFIDPFQEFIQPTKKMEKKYSITYSKWIISKKASDKLIGGKGIYIAPREHEGIGMGFLDAMALGKAVIAVDKPTMNEYIIHNKTGYLFNLDNPKEIDLSNIYTVQKNTYEYMNRGYKEWLVKREKIIKFIMKA